MPVFVQHVRTSLRQVDIGPYEKNLLQIIFNLWWVEYWLVNIHGFNGFWLYFSHPYLGDDLGFAGLYGPNFPGPCVAMGSGWQGCRCAFLLFAPRLIGDPIHGWGLCRGVLFYCSWVPSSISTQNPPRRWCGEAWKRCARSLSLGVLDFPVAFARSNWSNHFQVVSNICPIFPSDQPELTVIFHPFDLLFWCIHPLVQVAMSCSKVRSEGQAWETHAAVGGEGGIHARKRWWQRGPIGQEAEDGSCRILQGTGFLVVPSLRMCQSLGGLMEMKRAFQHPCKGAAFSCSPIGLFRRIQNFLMVFQDHTSTLCKTFRFFV